ncbi:hypothetical protein HPP92_015971 [Vanilla planifolia]|uniref:INO80 complex subunit B-like conserved region domain-containing protein n=1 Tax=Vanilla planifolia TaxID=51239 RepID=A0A835USJ0_VANPL|nr:hypothetical protein HPP92_015971 [Vanilla planifolia]
MDGAGNSGSGQPASSVVKKKRSSSVRRPRQGSPLLFGSRDPSSLSSTSSDNTAKLSRDDSSGYDGSSRRKEIYLNKQHPKERWPSNGEFETHYARSSLRDQGRIGSDVKRSSEGVLGPANWKNLSKLKENLEVNSLSSEQYGQSMHLSAGSSNTLVESKLKKVKLKVGGVTRTIPAKSNVGTNIIGSSSTKPSRSTDGPRPRQKSVPQENFDDSHSPREKGQGETWKDAVGPNSSRGKIAEGILSGRQRAQSLVLSSEPVRKSTRVPKRRVLDACQARADSRKKSRSGRLSDDTDYVEEDEPVSDDAPEEKKKKKQKKLPSDSSPDVRFEPLTTRQHAHQPGKDGNGSSRIEFPDGLPPAPPRKQKHKLSEVEEQAKKAEAAQRRKMQVEKAAKESEQLGKYLESILTKKRAEKEKAQAEKARAANSQAPAGSCIRWIMGPSGTVVIFPDDVGLPSLFDSKCSYPPPREKCAGPYCTNPYKYRFPSQIFHYAVCSVTKPFKTMSKVEDDQVNLRTRNNMS